MISLYRKDVCIAFIKKINEEPKYGPTVTRLTQFDGNNESYFTDNVFKTIVKQCPNIKSLSLGDSFSLTEKGIKKMRKLTHLNSIRVWYCPLLTIEKIKALCQLKNITELSLSSNNIDAPEVIAEFCNLKDSNFKSLDLDDNNINTPKKIGELSIALKSTKIESLSLNKNDIADSRAIIELIQNNPQLQFLHLRENRLSKKDLDLIDKTITDQRRRSYSSNETKAIDKFEKASLELLKEIKLTEDWLNKEIKLTEDWLNPTQFQRILEPTKDEPNTFKKTNIIQASDDNIFQSRLTPSNPFGNPFTNAINQTSSQSSTNPFRNNSQQGYNNPFFSSISSHTQPSPQPINNTFNPFTQSTNPFRGYQPLNQVVQSSPENNHSFLLSSSEESEEIISNPNEESIDPETLKQLILDTNKEYYSELQSQLQEMKMRELHKSDIASSQEIQELQRKINEIDQTKDQANLEIAELAKELKLLVNNNEKKLKKATRALYQELCGVKSNVDHLVLNHKKLTDIEAEQNYLNEHPSEAVRNFYRIGTSKLAASLMVIEMQGKVSTPDTFASNSAGGLGDVVGTAARALASLGDFGSAVPIVGAAVVLTGKIIKKACDMHEKGKIHNAEKIVSAIPPALCTRILAEEAIRLVTFRYEDMIVKLEADSAKEFAEKVTNKMICALCERRIRREDIEAGKSLPEQLMMVISTFEMKQDDLKIPGGKIPIGHIPLFRETRLEVTKEAKRTIENDTVTDEEILRLKTGLKRLNKDGAISLLCKLPKDKNMIGMKRTDKKIDELTLKAKENAECYGYRWATADECKGSRVFPAGTISKENVELSDEQIRMANFIHNISYIKKSEAKANKQAMEKLGKKEAKAKGIPYVKPNKFDVIHSSSGSKRIETTADKSKESVVNQQITDFEVKALIGTVEILKEQVRVLKQEKNYLTIEPSSKSQSNNITNKK